MRSSSRVDSNMPRLSRISVSPIDILTLALNGLNVGGKDQPLPRNEG